jgi:subtilase family serine protease
MALTLRVRAAALGAAALAGLAGLPALAGAPTGGALGAVAVGLPAWAHGSPAAPVAASAPVTFALLLRGRDAAGLAAFDRAVSTPGSPSYRHFLSHEAYAARFGPTTATVAAVTSTLHAAGLSVDAVSPSRELVYATGTAARVGALFGTSFARFDVAGALLRAPVRTPRAPAALAPFVAAVQGLAQSVVTVHDAPPPDAFINARPCSTWYAARTATAQPAYAGRHQPYAICGYTPAQVRGAYQVDATRLTGKGVTVAIVDAFASGTIVDDVNTYSRRHGLPPLAAGQFREDDPLAANTPEDPAGTGLVDPQGWAGEETLDVEAVHAMAPAADIAYVAAATPLTITLMAAEAQALEVDKAQVISNSWGSTSDNPLPEDKAVFDALTAQAAAVGTTIAFSSGDNGDEVAAGHGRTPDFPATSDQVTAVGGTTLEVTRSNRYGGEVYWGTRKTPLVGRAWDFGHTAFSGGGGGGVSTSYAEPTWQQGVVPTALATYGGISAGRVVPDLSLVADSTTGFLIGLTQTYGGTTKYGEYRIGGTSLSCPLFAGLVALADQKAGKGIGLVNPTLYAAVKAGHSRVLFHDPAAAPVDRTLGLSTIANVRPDYTDTTNPNSAVTYSLRTLGNLGTLHAYRGYDDSTGLGSPIAPALVALLG